MFLKTTELRYVYSPFNTSIFEGKHAIRIWVLVALELTGRYFRYTNNVRIVLIFWVDTECG